LREKFIRIAVLVVLVMGVAAQSTLAQGLLGKRYMGFEIGQTTPGDDDIKDVDDSILQLGGGINIPVNPNVDAIVNLSYAKLEGYIEGVDYEATAKGVLGGINYHFTPDQKVNPFVGILVGFVSTEAETSVPGYSESEDEDDFAIAVGAGVEVDLNDQVAIHPTIEYDKIDDEDCFIAGIGLSMWFNTSVFGGLSAYYAFDDGDVSYSTEIGFGF
jgi:opacity protein-like surface antigen